MSMNHSEYYEDLKEEEREEKEKKLVELQKVDDNFIRYFISRCKQIQSETRRNNRQELKGKSAKKGMTRERLITITKNLNKKFNEEGNEETLLVNVNTTLSLL